VHSGLGVHTCRTTYWLLPPLSRFARKKSRVEKVQCVARQIVPRDRFTGHHRLHADYFYENPIFGDDLFRRRFIFIHPLYCNTYIDGLY
jgi:hypothetical protein